MLRQGMVQEALADFNQVANLPNHLPQWSRVNALDKSRYPKAFLKDRLQPLPNPPFGQNGGNGANSSQQNGQSGRLNSHDPDDKELESSGGALNSQQRIQHLEKSLHFLRSQHQEVLANLHDEIDSLKRQNKELQFRIVMAQKPGSASAVGPHPPPAAVGATSLSAKHRLNSRPTASASNGRNRDLSAASRKSGARRRNPPLGADTQPMTSQHVTTSGAGSHAAPVHDIGALEAGLHVEHDSRMDDLKLVLMEEEVRELRNALQEEKSKNQQLTARLEAVEKEKQRQKKELERTEMALATAKAKEQEIEQSDAAAGSGPLPFNASLNPLQVHLPAQAPRPPTLRECEIIIRHLQHVGDKQAHELSQLKSDLRDVLYSHKWTPDAYLLAKAYIADDDARDEAAATAGNKLPKIPMKNTTRKLPDIAYIQKDAVSLPALRTGVVNQAVERQKRTQILQKAKMRKEIKNVE